MTNAKTKDTSGDLLNKIVKEFRLKNDAAVAKFLDLAPPVVSKIRNGKLKVGASVVLRVMKATAYTLDDIEALLGRTV